MKKILIAVLIVLLLTGCGDKKEEGQKTNKKNNTTTTTEKPKPNYKLYESTELQYDDSDSYKEKEYVNRLYLLDDGKFWYVHGFTDSLEYSEGTYKDETLSEEKVHSTIHECFYPNEYHYEIEYNDTGLKLTQVFNTTTKVEMELKLKETDEALPKMETYIDQCLDI